MKGVVFDIQQYALHDGPGIRTTVFLKGCPLRCAWCHNPESQSPEPELGYYAERCVLCRACVEVCPEAALTIEGGAHRRYRDRCAACGRCVEACPNDALTLIGEERDADDIAVDVAADLPFFEGSGGGVTVSGGEPTAQPDFLLALLDALGAAGVHRALETCGFFPSALLPKLTERCELFLFDLKHAGDEAHEAWTGVPLTRIRDNLRALVETVGPERVVPRVPLVPGVNTEERTLAGVAALLREVGHPGPIHLMPYNPLARDKWTRLDRGHEYRDFGRLSDDVLARIRACFETEGFEVEVSE